MSDTIKVTCGKCGQPWELADCCPDPDYGELCAPCSEAESKACLANALVLLARTPDPNALMVKSPKTRLGIVR